MCGAVRYILKMTSASTAGTKTSTARASSGRLSLSTSLGVRCVRGSTPRSWASVTLNFCGCTRTPWSGLPAGKNSANKLRETPPDGRLQDRPRTLWQVLPCLQPLVVPCTHTWVLPCTQAWVLPCTWPQVLRSPKVDSVGVMLVQIVVAMYGVCLRDVAVRKLV
jgi:hypothetical protein